MKNIRCEEVLVQLVVRTYDELGRPTGERVVGQANGAGGVIAMKVFRNAETRDFWGWVDKAIDALSQQPQPAQPPTPSVAPPAAVAPKKRRGRG